MQSVKNVRLLRARGNYLMDGVYHLSKSGFTHGLQCHKQLWWRVHEPGAPELVSGVALHAIFDQGSRVGEVREGTSPEAGWWTCRTSLFTSGRR